MPHVRSADAIEQFPRHFSPFAHAQIPAIEMAMGRGVPEGVRLALLRRRAWVSGKWVEAASKKTFPVLNPANGELIAEVRTNKSLV